MTSVAFALLSPSAKPLPSTRIACLNIFPLLGRLGLEPKIVFDPDVANETPEVTGLVEKVLAQGVGVVVFQKIHGNSVLAAVRRLGAVGVRTIYCVCDLVDNEMAEATDATVVVTDFLKSLYAPALQERIHVVHDGIEHPEHQRTADPSHRGRLTATLVTSHPLYRVPVIDGVPAGWAIDIVGAFPPQSAQLARLRALRWVIEQEERGSERWRILSAALDPRIRHLPWRADSVYSRLCASDIAIIPIDTRNGDALKPASWKVKSENRLTLKMAIGLPLIATPIPAYEALIEHGVNGFFARSSGDWKHCFERLRDPQLRAEMGSRARASVVQRFSQSLQAERFARVVHTVVSRSDQE